MGGKVRPSSALPAVRASKQPASATAAGREDAARPSATMRMNLKGAPGRRRRPRTAPSQRRDEARVDEPPAADWYVELRRNGLLAEQQQLPQAAPPRPQSLQYLRESAERRRAEALHDVVQTQREEEARERASIARMSEASRWSQSLGLGKKFQPLFARTSFSVGPGAKTGDGPAASGGGRADAERPETVAARGRSLARGALGFRDGELRCEVVSREDWKSCVVSCELFDREHAKLRVRYQQMMLREQTAVHGKQGLAPSHGGDRDESAVPVSALAVLKRRGSIRHPLLQTQAASSVSLLASRAAAGAAANASSDERKRFADKAVEAELREVLEQTNALAAMLREQTALLKDNGWNIQY